MKNILAALLLFTLSFTVSANDDRYWWTGASAGVDVNGDYVATTLSGGWFPKTRDFSWGVQSYLEAGRYNYDEGSGNAVTIGVEPVLTWKGFYAGMGLSLGNITPNLGTVWNFSSVGGYRYQLNDQWYLDANVRHRSHAARLGIESDKANGGVTIVNLQVGVNW